MARFDDQKKQKFIQAVRGGCSLTTAAKHTGISYQTYRNHYREDSDQYDEDFHNNLDMAIGDRNQAVENALWDLAVNGGRGQIQAIRTFLSNMIPSEWSDQEKKDDEEDLDRFVSALEKYAREAGDE